jgi:hypothetical protein
VHRAAQLTCPVPDTVARLGTLRSLNLSYVFLETVPTTAGLTSLEELDLRGSLSALLPRLPDLATLPRLDEATAARLRTELPQLRQGPGTSTTIRLT